MQERKVFAIDIDGILTIPQKDDFKHFESVLPNKEAIEKVNDLYDNKQVILIYSARREEDRFVTEAWLKKNKVKYHALILEKPLADIYIDDRSSDKL